MASPTAIPPHVVVNLVADDDMSPPPYSSSSAPPRRQASLGTRIRRLVVDRYTDEEARINLVGGGSRVLFYAHFMLMNLALLFLDAELLALTLAAREEIYHTRMCSLPFVFSILTSSRRAIRDVVLAFRRPQRPLL
jgi:hypothetical protein